MNRIFYAEICSNNFTDFFIKDLDHPMLKVYCWFSQRMCRISGNVT